MAPQHRQFLAAAFVLAAALMPARAYAQQNGTVTGTVTDQERQAPIPEAQVVVVGTTLGGRTNAQGVYTIAGVPAGTTQVRVLRIGFQSLTRPVTVVAGQSTRVDFAVAPSAVVLDQVITTATGEQQRQREKGVTVGRIDLDSLNKAQVTNLSDVLSSRTAGVTVQTAGGTTGSASRIRIRGSNSISLSNDPILIVDGIRVDNNSQSSRIGVGGQNPSRFNDINPDDIQNIEIVKGPAAAALYGTAAANGVIQVTTKRGQSGKTQWTGFAEGGTVNEVTDYPANYEQLGDYGGGQIFPCPLPEQAAGNCAPTGALSIYNPLEQSTPFRMGNRQKYGLSAGGGADRATYYVSGDVEREQGVYAPNLLERYNLRANITGQLLDNFKVTVTSGYLRSSLGRPQNDNNSEGVVSGGLLGTAFYDSTTHGYFGVTPEDLFTLQTQQNINRFTNGFNATWQVLPWLSANGTAGLDWTRREDVFNVAPGVFPASFDPDAAVGQRQLDPFDFFNYTGNGNVTATYLPMSDVTTSTSLGVQWNRDYTHGIEAFGQNITPGIGSLKGANALFSIDEASQTNVTLGGYVSEQVAWRDRVFATAALRTDKNSAFGSDFGWVYYPAASLSWVIGEEGFFPQQRFVSSLRLRAAFGESGQRPSFRDASTFFGATTATLKGDVPALVLSGTGNSLLKPEKSAEFETGFDATLFGDAARLEFTYYKKNTTNALVARRLAASLGATNSRFDNIGKVENNGIEMLLDAKIYQSDPIALDFTLTGSTNKNRVVSLGEKITPIVFGLGGNTQRHQNGYPLGGYWQQPILGYADTNNDGLLSPDEVQIGDTGVFLGTPSPRREFSVRPRLTLIKNIELSALFDYRSGFKLYNATEDFRCSVFINCRAVNDPTTPLKEQARAVADYAYGTVAGYIEDASFTKLREVALVFRAPNAWANRFRVNGLSLTLAGRNLATWTDYTGLDPEVTFAGATNFTQAEFLSQPAVRYYTARVNVNF